MTVSVSICPAPILQVLNNAGQPNQGGSILTQVGGINYPTYQDQGVTALPNPIPLNSRGEVSDVSGHSQQLFLVSGVVYTFTYFDVNGNQIDNPQYVTTPAPNTAASIGLLLYPQSSAELAASVIPTAYFYPCGDLRRYGALPSSDVTTALQQASAQAQESAGSPIYIPSALGSACTLSAGVTLATPITVYGDGRESSILTTTKDISVFTLTQQSGQAGCTFRDFQLYGLGRTVTQTAPAFAVQGSPYNSWIRMRVTNFGYGIYFYTSTYSCYLNSIIDSEINACHITNIVASAQTHNLTMHKVTFGAAYNGPALYHTDSQNLSIIGGDCEANGVGSATPAPCSIDIDNAGSTANGGHVISGVDFESSIVTIAEIRVGATNPVGGVSIMGNIFSNSGSVVPYILDCVNANGVVVSGNREGSTGYSTGPFNLSSTTYNFRAFGNTSANGGSFGSDFSYQSATIKSLIALAEASGSGVTINAAMGDIFVATVADNGNFSVAAPSNANSGQEIAITIKNASGGALGTVTWNSIFKMAGGSAPSSPANANSRTIKFYYNGTDWQEISRVGGDVSN